jgi:hypothetical protein
MAIWNVAPIDEQPELTLIGWKIYEVDNGDRHCSGYCEENYEGRASSKIIEFDDEKNIGKTRSGRVYKLSDKPAKMSQILDALYVWNSWLAINGLKTDQITTVGEAPQFREKDAY